MDGVDLSPLPPERRRIGMVFQDYALFPARTVAGNISYGPAVAGVPRDERNRMARSLAAELGIERLLDRYPASLSGGERQRVALARTLAARPSLVLLDEPLSSLDEGLRKRLRLEISERLRGSGTAALHVTHDVEEALAISDRLYLMRGGRIEASGRPEDLYAEPPSAWAASFMGAGPVIPIWSIAGSPEYPVARCSLGDIKCRAASFDASSSERHSLFFPSGAATISSYDRVPLLQKDATAGINRFTCRIVSTFFTGPARRLVLSCGYGEDATLIELDQPASVPAARGDSVRVELPVFRCSILPGSPTSDMSRS
jgi:ABC-type Fe3+/spermidine/putrescine transport system ATPase subunit